MIDLNLDNNRENARLLLTGIWYSDLPDIIDIDEVSTSLDAMFNEINNRTIKQYQQDPDGFITDWKNIASPEYIRSPGVEAISFFDFKKNGSLREMQIPNFLHYISFVYNSLYEFPLLFEPLYISEANHKYIENSNSYLVFEDAFCITAYDGEEHWTLGGTFTTKNNKMNSSAILNENRRRILEAEKDHLFVLKMDIESFFPNLYTHYFEKIFKYEPFSIIGADEKYFRFLDHFHQRINNNQTKGVPAGIFSSHVAAELCMLCVDAEIRNYLSDRDREISYIRYVDDLTFYSDYEGELKELFPVVQGILNKYRLRINGNKTESMRSVYVQQQTYIAEIEKELPFLNIGNAAVLHLADYFEIKKYIQVCLENKRSSQIRALLGIILKRISSEKINVSNIITELFYLTFKLVFEDVTVTCSAYRLLDELLQKATSEKDELINSLLNKRAMVDREYPNTILQIWYYYVLTKHCNASVLKNIVDNLSGMHYNPIVIATFVEPGKKNNMQIFRYICDTYQFDSPSGNWKKEIMYSKWWLPIMKIYRYDSHDYCKFMQSNNIPDIYKFLPAHGNTF